MEREEYLRRAALQVAIILGIQMGGRLERAGILNDVDLEKHHGEVDSALSDAANYVWKRTDLKSNDISDPKTMFKRDLHLTIHIEDATEQIMDYLLEGLRDED